MTATVTVSNGPVYVMSEAFAERVERVLWAAHQYVPNPEQHPTHNHAINLNLTYTKSALETAKDVVAQLEREAQLRKDIATLAEEFRAIIAS